MTQLSTDINSTNAKKTRVILVGIGYVACQSIIDTHLFSLSSGATCSGKTTLAKHLLRILPNSFIIHQDVCLIYSSRLLPQILTNDKGLCSCMRSVHFPYLKISSENLSASRTCSISSRLSSPRLGCSCWRHKLAAYDYLPSARQGDWSDPTRSS